jgi:hypothetical protein
MGFINDIFLGADQMILKNAIMNNQENCVLQF